ncbi:hypothetical protein KEJ36_04300 [Candidatus Bathyarchaeota archaeon]|nr:hypothetical protein [Candidatus Bathyarchaeota archaeon]
MASVDYKAILEEIRRGRAALEVLESVIPGYRGYKEREMRRETDRLVRNILYERLIRAKDAIRIAYFSIVERGLSNLYEGMNRLNAVMDRVSERVNHAEYGYAGFFDAIKVKEEALDRMLSFDANLLKVVQEVEDMGQKLMAAGSTEPATSIKERLDALMGSLRELETIFNERKNVILGLKGN